MEKYILILLTLLVLLVIVVLFFGYKKLNYLSVDVARNTKNIIAIQSLLSNHSFLDRDDDHYNDRSMRGENERKVKFSDNEHNNGVGLPKEIDLDDLDDNDNDNDDNDDNNDKSSDELGDEEDYDEVHSVVLEVSDDERGTQLSSENSTTETKDKPHNKNVSLSDFLEQVGDTEEEKEEKEEEEQVSPFNEDDQEDNHSEGGETSFQDVKIIEIKSKKTKGKNIPNDDVNELDVGETRLSENDGKLYEVVQNKNGTKRWKLSK